MKSHVAQKDAAKQSSKTSSRPAAEGGQGLSAAPPAYGIGFVDEMLLEAEPRITSAPRSPVVVSQSSRSSKSFSGLLQSANIQAKLAIGTSDDPLEQEADRVADAVDQPPVSIELTANPDSRVRRKSQKAGGGGAAALSVRPAIPGLENNVRSASQRGKPLDTGLRSFMESRIGADFSQVKIHTGPLSAQLNREMSSQAFTHGGHIHFADGKYDPLSPSGRRLLAHELAHVAQQGSATNSEVVRRNGGDELVYTLKIPDIVKTREDLFRVINLYVFGVDNGTAWVDLDTQGDVDVASVKGTRVRIHVPRSVVEQATDPAVKTQREESKKTFLGLKGGVQGDIANEADKRYYQRSGDKPGTKIRKGEEGKSQVWDQALTDVLKDKDTLEKLPPAIKELMGPERSYKPKDYEHLLKIAEKLKNFTPEDLAAYKLLTIRATDNLDLFEKSVDLFLARREELKKALDQQLQQQPQQPATQPSPQEKNLQETIEEKWQGLDESAIGTMSESDRYALARQKTTELTEAQLNYMKQHPGETVKDFAKSALLLNTGETFKGIGKDITEAANGDANSWARWAAGTGAGAKLSGWLLAVAGVIYVASWFTGIGELATIAAAAGILLGATLTLSLAESELRIKAASQAKTPEEFKRNVELAAAARANVIVGVALIVVAVVLRALAKALFPETMKKISTSVKNFRERVRLKGSIYEIKPEIRGDLASLRGELAKRIEAAKAQAATEAADIEKLSTEEFAAKLDKGGAGTIFDQSKLPPEQKLNYGELLQTPEGRNAIEGYRTRLVNALKTDVPAELDRVAQEYNSKIDDFLKDVEAAQNHDELKSAADKIEGSLTEEHAKQFMQGEQQKITAQKLEEASSQAHQEALKLARDAIVSRVKARIAGLPEFKLTYTDTDLDAIVNKGRELGLTDRLIEDLIYVGSRAKKAISAGELMQQMENWAKVSQRGFPFKFPDLPSFQRFSADLLGLLRGIGLPVDDVRIQGSALRTPTANDVDIAVFVEQSAFGKLLTDRFDLKVRKNGTPVTLKGKTHAELAKVAAEIESSPKETYNGIARTWARAFKNGIFNSHSDVLEPLKSVQKSMAAKYPDLNIETVSVSSKGGAFELKPDLPVKSP